MMFNIHNDIVAPAYITAFQRPTKTLLTIWEDFIRFPRHSHVENLFCVIQGTEVFKVVSPIYKQNIYTGVFDEYGFDSSPVDLFNPDYDMFPLMKHSNILETTVEAGDCIFVPAQYWYQSQTKGEKKTIMINYGFQPHSELFNIFFNGVDEHILEK